MGYSDSLEVLKQRLPFLQEVIQGREVKWTVPVGTSKKWAYKVRESLYIAAKYPRDYPELAKAAEEFRVRVLNNHEVALIRKTNISQPTTVVTNDADHSPMMEDNSDHILAGITTEAYTSMAAPAANVVERASDIITEWLKQQPSNSVRVLNTALSDEEKFKLYTWGQQQLPRVIFFDGIDSITAQFWREDSEGLYITPEDLSV